MMNRKLKAAFQTVRNEGARGLYRDVVYHVFKSSSVAPYLRRVFGDALVEKFILYSRAGYWPHIENPRSFNEKVLHRKLYTENELFSTVSDKWGVRDYVEERVGADVLNEVYHVTTDPETIPFEDLPNEFVVKATHGSNMAHIVNDKATVDPESLRDDCHSWLAQSYGSRTRESWYGDIQPRIVVENRLHGRQQDVPLDYKFFVFHGEPKLVQVDIDRFDGHSRRMYDLEWEPLDIEIEFPMGSEVEEPERLDEMIDIAGRLGSDFDFARVDLYETEAEGVVFGEITLAPGSGYEAFDPVEADFELGGYW